MIDKLSLIRSVIFIFNISDKYGAFTDFYSAYVVAICKVAVRIICRTSTTMMILIFISLTPQSP